MSRIPLSIRKILDSGRNEVNQLEQQYRLWVALTVMAGIATLCTLITFILLLSIDTSDNLLVLRILLGLATILELVVFYAILQETLTRRRYLFEIQQLMISGLSFIDSVRRGMRDLFK